MKTHEMTLDDPFFEEMNVRKKKYEIRIFDEKRQKMLLGDTIVFKKKNSDETIQRKIINLMLFDTFKDALETIKDFREVLPSIETIEDAVSLYEKIPHKLGDYSIASEKFGIVLIKLE